MKRDLLEELETEMRDHIDRETQDNIDRGMSPAEARTAALRRFGNVTGVAAGLLLSLGAGFALRGFLFGLSPLDPLSYAAVAIILGTAALLATAVPVRRAVRVDPAVTLRTE